MAASGPEATAAVLIDYSAKRWTIKPGLCNTITDGDPAE